MAKHQHPQDEPPALSIRRHAIVAAAVASLFLAGATGWALTRPDLGSDDGVSRGLGPQGQQPGGALEGFGPASLPASRNTVSARPTVTVSASPVPASPSAPAPSRSATTIVTGLDAAYTMLTWQGGYQVTFSVTNPTATPVLWKIRVQLPSNARYDHSWSAELARDGDILTFTPPKWDNGNPRPLAPGTTHAFGFIAAQPSGDYRMLSCAIDGVPCRLIRP